MRPRNAHCWLFVLLWTLCFGVHGAFAQYASVKWVKVDDSQVALILDGVQAGNLRLADGVYFPVEGDGFGAPVDCPVDIPEEYRPKAPPIADWRTTGVIKGRIKPGVHIGGDPEAVERVNRQAEAGADAAVKIPAFQRMPSVTIVSQDKTAGERIRADFEKHPALAPFRDHRVKVYTNPADPLLAPFKLAEDREFQRTGLAIIVQPAPDEHNRAPVTSIYTYESADEVAGKLRSIEAEYDPNDTEYSGFTKADVGLGVGLGVTGIFSLLIGGLWKWLR